MSLTSSSSRDGLSRSSGLAIQTSQPAIGDALAAGFLVETNEAECVAEIGERERALTVRGRRLDDVVNAHDAVGNREFGVNAKMDEAGI